MRCEAMASPAEKMAIVPTNNLFEIKLCVLHFENVILYYTHDASGDARRIQPACCRPALDERPFG